MSRKGKSGMSNGSGGALPPTAPTATPAQVGRAIDRASFSNEGGGNYQLDIPGVGGGQVLDETGSSRDPMYGRGGKVYSARTWDADYNMIGVTEYVSSLNDAKRIIKNNLKNNYGTRG